MKIDAHSTGINYTYGTSATGSNNSRKHLGYEQYSGTECQQTGKWQGSMSAAGLVVSVQKGNVMPYHQAQPVKWKLVDYGIDETLLSS
jgi:hypothetical protein